MLEARRIELQQAMDEAYAAGNTSQIEALRRTIDRETLECTAHTAERLKRVEKNVDDIKKSTNEIRDEIKKRDLINQGTKAGAKLLWDALKVVAGAGGGMWILKALGG